LSFPRHARGRSASGGKAGIWSKLYWIPHPSVATHFAKASRVKNPLRQGFEGQEPTSPRLRGSRRLWRAGKRGITDGDLAAKPRGIIKLKTNNGLLSQYKILKKKSNLYIILEATKRHHNAIGRQQPPPLLPRLSAGIPVVENDLGTSPFLRGRDGVGDGVKWRSYSVKWRLI